MSKAEQTAWDQLCYQAAVILELTRESGMGEPTAEDYARAGRVFTRMMGLEEGNDDD